MVMCETCHTTENLPKKYIIRTFKMKAYWPVGGDFYDLYVWNSYFTY